MSASQLKDADFNRVISDYYETGQLSSDIFLHLDQIGSYTLSKPNFKGYSPDWAEGMKERARDKAINTLVARKYDISKVKPFAYFSTIYYNEFLEYIKKKTKEQDYKKHLVAVYDYQPNGETKAPDPITILSPMIAWLVEEPISRLNVFLKHNYPELLAEEAEVDRNVEILYLKIFPGAKGVKTGYAVASIHSAINKLRMMVNNSPIEDEGIKVSLKALQYIIGRKLVA